MSKRIISLAPSNTEILFSLGAGNTVAGVTSFCDYPEQAKKLPKIGSWIYVNDMEKIKSLNPDLILTSMYVPPAIDEWSQKNKIRLVNLYPQTLEGIYESILEIGKLTEKEEKAKEIISEIKNNLETIKKESFKTMKKPRIYSEEFHKPPTVASNWVPELIEIAGGIPMAKPGILSYEVKLEDVSRFDPDIIILHWCGFNIKSKKEDLIKRGWNNLRAVRENKVFTIDDTFLNRPGPRIWQGAKLIKEALDFKPSKKY